MRVLLLAAVAKQLIITVADHVLVSIFHAHSYLSELSLSDLRALVAAVEQTLAALERESHVEEPE